MAKPANRLRALHIMDEVGSDNPLARDCAALLDECEHDIDLLLRALGKTGEDWSQVKAIRATLAKLRGK